LAVFAVSRSLLVGIDVERIRPEIVSKRLAAAILSAAEFEAFRTASDDERRDQFFSAWTQKEAYLKARGIGLAQALCEIDMSDARARMDPQHRLAGWTVDPLCLVQGYAGAVAVSGASGVSTTNRPY
jgi:4'-phosphopantetheinyl transferase